MTNWKTIRDEALAHLHAGMDFIRAIELASGKHFNTVAEVLDYISAESECLGVDSYDEKVDFEILAEEKKAEEPNLDEIACNTCDGCDGCVKAEPQQKTRYIEDTNGVIHQIKIEDISEIEKGYRNFRECNDRALIKLKNDKNILIDKSKNEVIQQLGIEVV